MVAFLVILTVAVCIIVDILRRQRAKAPVTSLHRLADKAVPPEAVIPERFFHPGHSWALVEAVQPVTVGADDIAQRIIGNPDRIEVTARGDVRQGEPFVTLHRGRRSITLAAPLSGVIQSVNPGLSADPSLLKQSPYEKGWIAKIVPSNLYVELRNLLKGALAERWREGVQAQIAALFAPQLGAVLQDGGQYIDNLGDLLSDQEWKALIRELFSSGETGTI